MADLKISQLPQLLNADVVGADSLPIVDAIAGQTKQIDIAQLDLRWRALPTGGTAGQVLTKASGVDGDVTWTTLTKASVGLDQVNNTSDANKPVSTATQAALNLKANTTAVALKADITYVDSSVATKQNLLPSGTDGYVLTLVSGTPQWQAGGGGGGAVSSVFGRTGTVTAQSGDYTKAQVGLGNVDNTSDMDKPVSTAQGLAIAAKQDLLPSGTNGYVLSLVSGSPAWVPAPASSPLTTKGDVYTFSTVNARLAVGTDGNILVADSTQTTGLKWAAPLAGAPTLIGSTGSPKAIVAADGFTSADSALSTTAMVQVIFFQGPTAATNTVVTATTPIQAHTIPGAVAYFIGMSDTQQLTIAAGGTGIISNGDNTSTASSVWAFIWTGAEWRQFV